MIAIAAAGFALVALLLAAWRFVLPAGDACQTTAWRAAPSAADLPPGWSISAAQYGVDQVTTTLSGPLPTDDTSAQALVYATLTCYAQDAATAVTLSEQAATAAGQQVSQRDDLGDQAYQSTDASGATYTGFRHGDIVVDVAASGETSITELDAVLSSLDRALGGDGTAAGLGTSGPTPGASLGPSGEPSGEPSGAVGEASGSPDAPLAPELEAALPSSIGDTVLTIESAVGSMILGDDAGSRAIVAALRAKDASPDDLQVAQAYDETGTVDLSLIGFRVPGIDGSDLEGIVRDAWLSANGSGVTTSRTELGDRTVTKVDYGDGGSLDYLVVDGDVVILIETADPELARQAEAALP